MDISGVRAIDNAGAYSSSAGQATQVTQATQDSSVKTAVAGASDTQTQNERKFKDPANMSKEDLSNLAQEFNKFLDLVNADLSFAIHEKTKSLMVQVISTKDRKVLREFPSHEWLDTIASIRDHVGMILNKKA